MLLGRHVSAAGDLTRPIGIAEGLGATAMQIFTRNPRSWKRGDITPEECSEFSAALGSSGIKAVVSHMPYLPNVASSEKDIYQKSVASLTDELRVCNDLGIGYLVSHLGSHKGRGVRAGIENVVNALHAVEKDIGKVQLLLENEAGQANSVGSKAEELAEILDLVGIRNVGICFDTCHLFAYGYDIRQPGVVEHLLDTVGERNVHVIHVNDAKQPLGSHLDRHENLGYGHIGMAGFESFFSNDDIAKKVLILETPVGEKIDERSEIDLARFLLQRGHK